MEISELLFERTLRHERLLFIFEEISELLLERTLRHERIFSIFVEISEPVDPENHEAQVYIFYFCGNQQVVG